MFLIRTDSSESRIRDFSSKIFVYQYYRFITIMLAIVSTKYNFIVLRYSLIY